MRYKILCSDLDGTLLTTKNDVSDVTINAISQIKSTTKIILTSARMPQAMTYLQQRLNISNEPLICYNGALVLDGEKELFSTTIPFNLVEIIANKAAEFNIKCGLYYNTEWYAPELTYRVQREINHTKVEPILEATETTLTRWATNKTGAHKIMLMCTKETADAIFSILENTIADEVHLYRSNDTLIEIAPRKVSKLSAIAILLKETESFNDVVAFGDNYNDMEMLENVGCGVAVGNARNEVIAIADYTTLKNTENGVAHFILEHLVDSLK